MITAERKGKDGKKREVDMCEVVNAIFYILRASGGANQVSGFTTMANSIFIFPSLGA
jgi:hypothetical protein